MPSWCNRRSWDFLKTEAAFDVFRQAEWARVGKVRNTNILRTLFESKKKNVARDSSIKMFLLGWLLQICHPVKQGVNSHGFCRGRGFFANQSWRISSLFDFLPCYLSPCYGESWQWAPKLSSEMSRTSSVYFKTRELKGKSSTRHDRKCSCIEICCCGWKNSCENAQKSTVVRENKISCWDRRRNEALLAGDFPVLSDQIFSPSSKKDSVVRKKQVEKHLEKCGLLELRRIWTNFRNLQMLGRNPPTLPSHRLGWRKSREFVSLISLVREGFLAGKKGFIRDQHQL